MIRLTAFWLANRKWKLCRHSNFYFDDERLAKTQPAPTLLLIWNSFAILAVMPSCCAAVKRLPLEVACISKSTVENSMPR